ncbi:MAG: hypothetical protein IKQ39_02765 [Oscillospiraceae bacterium]|nr:hypothetical protein [Oscillospiraceae bacterium]
MRKLLNRVLIFGAAACLTLSSAACGADESSDANIAAQMTEQTAAQTTTTTTTSATTTTTTATTTTTSETTTTETTTEVTTTSLPVSTIGEIVTVPAAGNPAAGDFTRSAEYDAFLTDTVFVGDSICSGLKVYHILPDDNVMAKGSVAARSIFDYKFDVRGNEFGLTYGLTVLDPKFVVFSMGMNDINMTSAEQYCKNYEYILDTVHSVLPNAKLFVASITPISNDITFSTNDKIDTYNQAIKDYLAGLGKGYGYVDISPYLKNQYNGLKLEYSGGDGIHLAPAAYQAILYQVCEQLVDTGIAQGTSKGGTPYGY